MPFARPLPLATLAALAALSSLAIPTPAGSAVVYPACLAPACSDPTDYASYLFLAPGQLPNDFGGGNAWKYQPATGMNVVGAWQYTTGRPDIHDAVLDSGIRWGDRELAKKVWLNVAELPQPCASPTRPSGRLAYDCDDDGAVTVDDFVGIGASDLNGNGVLDGQDLILQFSNGVDEDGNGYVDDIAGWDFADDDNDPFDRVDYGHGTGEGGDMVAEADNGGGFPGVAPSSFFVPLKVNDSFIAVDSEFAAAVVYAVDNGADSISSALGTISMSPSSQQAVDYAYRRGVPILASAADEQSRHHNMPSNADHTIWVNSIRDADGTFASSVIGGVTDYTVQNGCTNHGGRAWVAISSTSCSSEATGRSAGMTLLIVSHGRNLIDRGLLAPYPGLDKPFSVEEIRQLFRLAAQDIDHSVLPPLPPGSLGAVVSGLLGAPGFPFGSYWFPTQAGWDQYTGWGRPDLAQLLAAISAGNIPPEADLTGSLAWFDTIDPVRTPSVDVVGSAAAVRAGGGFSYQVEVGCGVQPSVFGPIGSGTSAGRIESGVLAQWSPAATAAACGFDPATPPAEPDDHTVQLKLTVTDGQGRTGIDVRTVAIHHDATERFAPIVLGASGESSSVLVDVDRDGVQEIVQGTGSGALHVIRGSDGKALPGFPVHTDVTATASHVRASNAWGRGEVTVPHEAIIASIAADDLDGDGSVEIVAAGTDGHLYVWDAFGARRPGFPVRSNPAFSGDAVADRYNDTDPGFLSAPVLVDLDPAGPGNDGTLEILVGGLDGHLYAWRANGTPVAGFPVRLADPSRLTIDAATGKVTPRAGSNAKSRLSKVLSSAAVADLDGDGDVEIVIATNEEYGDNPAGFYADSALLAILLGAGQLGIDLGDFSLDAAGRVYAVHHDGNLHAGGPFAGGWPVAVPLLTAGLLPTVGTGTPGSAAIADLDGNGRVGVAIFSTAGPVVLLNPDGTPVLGSVGAAPRVLPVDFPNGGFPSIPATAGSADAPFFGALGSGAFGDITGDGLPEYVAATGGVRALLDVGVAASQEFGDHSITAWDPAAGTLLPAFPRKMDDMQFLSSPGLADVDGDGVAEIVQGSGAYLVRAFRADGSEPAGWPKFTHGWMIPSPTAGDVDGDGLIEVVASSREGKLYVWDTPAPATDAAIPWQGFGGNRRNTKSLLAPVSATATAGDPLEGLVWNLRSIDAALRSRSLPKGSFSGAALRLALLAVEQGRASQLAGALPLVHQALVKPPKTAPLVADLHAQFLSGLSRAIHRAAETLVCAPGDAACAADKALLGRIAAKGDQLLALGNPQGATAAWARGVTVLVRRF